MCEDTGNEELGKKYGEKQEEVFIYEVLGFRI